MRLLLPALLTVLVFSSCRRISEKEAASRFDKALKESAQRIDAGDADGAVRVLEVAVTPETPPMSAEVLLLKAAEIEMKRGRGQAALALCDRAIAFEAKTGSLIGHGTKANVLLSLNRKQEAGAEIRKFFSRAQLTDHERKDMEAKLKTQGL
ncbi:MAG: hypothetical protein HY077_18670 [Elusimicrobia bacterium]|nr:hypothetical protein [Elusimicrobiota bacterium]